MHFHKLKRYEFSICASIQVSSSFEIGYRRKNGNSCDIYEFSFSILEAVFNGKTWEHIRFIVQKFQAFNINRLPILFPALESLSIFCFSLLRLLDEGIIVSFYQLWKIDHKGEAANAVLGSILADHYHRQYR